jgi:hypothetical protein
MTLPPSIPGLERKPARRAGFRAMHETQAGRLTGMSEPAPKGVCVVTQAPWSTSFQALP